MSLTRKFLQAMGIDADKIDEIISAHTETVNALKEERDGYKADAEKLPEVQKDLDKAKSRITELEGEDGKDKWKVKYDALKEEYAEYKTGVDAEKSKQKKSDAYRKLLKDVGVSEKRIDSVLKVTDLSTIEFNEDGTLKDEDKLREGIKSEWEDFITTGQMQGAKTETPPAGTGAGATNTPSRAAQVAQKHYEMLYGKKAEDNK